MFDDPQPYLEVFLLPLAADDPAAIRRMCHGAGMRVDPGALARRIPDFLHQLLNRGYPGPTGLLNVQAASEDGPVRWAELREVPSAEEAFAMVPEGADVRAVVTGTLGAGEEALELTLHVHRAEDLEVQFGTALNALVRLGDPVPDLLRVARRLAGLLELPEPHEDRPAHTHRGAAFFKLLEGIDNAALVTSGGQWAAGKPEEMLAPFHQALDIDPGFGLALRMLSEYLMLGYDSQVFDQEACARVLDRCFSVQPVDGEGCVSVADHFTRVGDKERALAWLEHATHLDPPPPRGLENLGILHAIQGDTRLAQELWTKGLDIDGHPDFCAHLARLAFTEGRDLDAWDHVLRGLKRMSERCDRAAEWEDDGRGCGVLLRLLNDFLDDHRAPEDAVESLMDLAGKLEDPLELGLCLLAVDQPLDARTELQEGLLGDLSATQRDHAVRGLLRIHIDDFEARFAKAIDEAVRGRHAARAVRELTVFYHVENRFWPALFFLGLAKSRLGKPDEAIDDLAQALILRPGQADCLREIARLYDERGNPKRALECVEQALTERPEDVELMLGRARYLWRLDRMDDARTAVQQVEALAPRNKDLARLRREMAADS